MCVARRGWGGIELRKAREMVYNNEVVVRFLPGVGVRRGVVGLPVRRQVVDKGLPTGIGHSIGLRARISIR